MLVPLACTPGQTWPCLSLSLFPPLIPVPRLLPWAKECQEVQPQPRWAAERDQDLYLGASLTNDPCYHLASHESSCSPGIAGKCWGAPWQTQSLCLCVRAESPDK